MTAIDAITSNSAMTEALRRACLRVAPLWSPEDLVAVNPFVGYADEPIVAAAERVRRCLGLPILPEAEHLRQAWKTDGFSRSDIDGAASELGQSADLAAQVAAWLDGSPGESLDGPRVLTVAARCTVQNGCDWTDAVVATVTSVLAGVHSQGISRWPALSEGSLWTAWRSWAQVDRSLEMRGLAGFRAVVAALPDDHTAVSSTILGHLEIPVERVDDYVTALFGQMPGWAGRLRQMAWHGDGTGALPELAAILLICESALATLLPTGSHRPALPAAGAVTAGLFQRLVLLHAVEGGFRRRTLRAMTRRPTASTERSPIQTVWCIDVRSEPLRYAVEAADPQIETMGFAGFFAIGVNLSGSARVPVLLQPGGTVGLTEPGRGRGVVKRLLGHLRRSAVGGFSYMETAGFLSFGPLLRETIGQGAAGIEGDVAVGLRPELCSPLDLKSLLLDQRVAMAGGLLRHLSIANPARLLVLCGHDASCANNPQAAGLACGACGGHGGGLNARVAATLLNQSEVRARLRSDGGGLPDDTVVVAAVHDTVTDQVVVLDRSSVPASHAPDLARLEAVLTIACGRAAVRRTGSLPAADHEHLAERARDWAEVRPEWALAGNAAFIAARRCRTVGLDLGGRCFLNSYDESRDHDGAGLELILTAPVVVASWINLQYYGSAINPERLGSGRKTIHNPVGNVGVLSGNHGDLAVGLAFESVHDGERLRHLPQRLQVVVEAHTARIDAVVARHAGLRDLVHHGWIVLIALDPHGAGWQRWHPGSGWMAEET